MKHSYFVYPRTTHGPLDRARLGGRLVDALAARGIPARISLVAKILRLDTDAPYARALRREVERTTGDTPVITPWAMPFAGREDTAFVEVLFETTECYLLSQSRVWSPDPCLAIGRGGVFVATARRMCFDTLADMWTGARPVEENALMLSTTISEELILCALDNGARAVYATRDTDAQEVALARHGFTFDSTLDVWRREA